MLLLEREDGRSHLLLAVVFILLVACWGAIVLLLPPAAPVLAVELLDRRVEPPVLSVPPYCPFSPDRLDRAKLAGEGRIRNIAWCARLLPARALLGGRLSILVCKALFWLLINGPNGFRAYGKGRHVGWGHELLPGVCRRRVRRAQQRPCCKGSERIGGDQRLEREHILLERLDVLPLVFYHLQQPYKRKPWFSLRHDICFYTCPFGPVLTLPESHALLAS